jgi:hypothetical protein
MIGPDSLLLQIATCRMLAHVDVADVAAPQTRKIRCLQTLA